MKRRLIIADATQIEPRCLAWLSDDQEKLTAIRSGVGVYQLHAVQTMGHDPKVDLKSTDKNRYLLSKVRVLGLGYQCGGPKFQAFAEIEYGYYMTQQEAKQQVKDFRAKEKKIVQMWTRLHNDFQDSIQNPEFVELPDGRQIPAHIITLPSGREMHYYHPRHARRSEVFKPKKKKQVELQPIKQGANLWANTAEVKSSDYRLEMCAQKQLTGGIAFFYGGLLTENVTQSCARDVFNEMMIRVEDEFGDYAPILFHSHDEIILDADPGISTKEVEEVMAISPTWMADCPFGAEAIEADHYMK